MDKVRPFYPRAQTEMGNVIVQVKVANLLEPGKQRSFAGIVDTGAFGLVLPLAWKDELGPFPDATTVEVETADQRVVEAEVCGPVRIQIEGFRRIIGEAVFMEMHPGLRGYEPLVGYTVLELSGVAVDMVSHRLVARKYYDLKRVARTLDQSGTTAGSGV
jgi:predicted aspartyl protease